MRRASEPGPHSPHPEHGARIVLTLRARDPVRYEVGVYLAEAVFCESALSIAAGDAIVFEPWSKPPPEWTVTFVERLAKTLSKRHAEPATWPRKITRWRAP